ncbi:SH2 domain-containing adapter protein B isoform X2 [Canis lupus baileyi]|uniref:SH2 domain-containing adapter protein B isoform X2 n=1 Tax=Canis lupus dingo TaxID=286419 RepID=UPI000DC6AA2C|nr:SH2 domain-containing adapter protein B isoform X2 [Canis lupus dingo]XP_038408805.1 SH2 domain-containing adapter protein B isoform X2 [Canis lupus familiaris]XP_038519799.1 SH2 domain-containing adapter protein B isoform X2 [Canis lupus familiaris]XP_038538135.1 SH2 domain-containing adapter protein B isoform X2 [Canis lupus familiaris]
MAKWLNKYFSLGNSKTKSPPQPPRPDYREQRRRGERPSQAPQAVPQAPAGASASCGPTAASCFSTSSGSLPDDSGSTSDLIRAYRAQKERDFEDPYNGPGSSLRKLRAMCRLDYCGGGGEPGGGQRAFSASSASGAAGCCCASSGAGAAASSSSSSGSPHLYRSSSERRPATPAEVRYISPKHRLIKVESAAGGAGDLPGGACSGGRTWSPTACGGKKLLNKCAASAAEESGAGKKDKVTIADDYSDPFDAKNDLKSKAGKGESAGYMEPYEAQRIMTEFQRQESVRSQHKGIQLYDTPYEPEGQSVDSDSESTVSPRLRESKLPQDDDRPADEYDQPWEWNRVTIPALAAQFNGNEKRQSSPSPSRDRRRQLRAPGGGFKPIKHGSPEFCGILGERVDPAVPLEKQIWYHGAISRGDAENLLRLCKECSYLVRNSQTSKHDYSLSLN